MRILGADLSRFLTGARQEPATLVLLGASGEAAAVRHPFTIPQVAADTAELAGDEPFLLGVNLPVVVPEKAQKQRPVESLIRRRLGHRLPPGGRAALPAVRGGVGGEALLQALAGAGHPCLPYPDRDRRRSGVAEIHATLVLKSLLWEGAAAGRAATHPERETAFRGYEPPPYRASAARGDWTERAMTLDLALRGLAGGSGPDTTAARDALASAASDADIERAGSIFDAILLAATARLYLDEPERCAFLGDREHGYVILPADAFVRRVAIRESVPPGRGGLFPRASLRDRLGPRVEIKPLDLLAVPGRAPRVEAAFEACPLYEFDNLDEMLWWKHCRHLSGAPLPTEGLVEMMVRLGVGDDAPADEGPALRLVRSRHRTLSFRFDPPPAWRARVPTRDGRTYPFRVVRAVFETRSAES